MERHFTAHLSIRDGDPESVARMRQDRMGNRRPLSEPGAAVLRAAAAPLLRDLAAAGEPVPEIKTEACEEDDQAVYGLLAAPRGSGQQRIWVIRDISPAEQVTGLAAEFQDWTDEQLGDEWPVCPEHGFWRQLQAHVRDGAAVWICPDGHVISLVGALPQARPEGSG